MSKSYMSIGEYAKMVGVSPEYLKFYDKKGLVKPAWKDDRSYRYYADYQITYFTELQQLNNIGVSLEAAKDIIDHANLEDRLHLYKNAYKAKLEELESLSYLIKQIEDTTEALDRVNSNAMWRIEKLPLSYFVYVEIENRKSQRDSAIWKDFFSMNITQYVKLDSDNCYELIPGNYNRKWGAIQPKLNSYVTNDVNNTIIPVGDCKCFVYEHSIPAEYDENHKLLERVWDFSLPLSILKDNNLKHKGQLFQKRLCVTHEDNGDFLQVQTIIPLS